MRVHALLLAAAFLLPVRAGQAADPDLTISAGGATTHFTAAALLARPDAASIDVPHDVAYGRAMTWRAVPLAALLAALPTDPADTLEARATDGFVSQIPRALLTAGATAWIAVEDPAHRWPPLAGKSVSAGPFYLVWQNPERGGVGTEQWPYALAAIAAVESPTQRWPKLAVDPGIPANAPARRGLSVFLANCRPCHRLAGAGEADIGPDLLTPMPATVYFTIPGLRALIRNPKSVRTWPQQQMPAFDPAALPDADIQAVIAYLQYAAGRPK